MKNSSHLPRQAHGGFTLIELLVVVAVILTLLSIMFPLTGKMLEQAKITSCKANLESIGGGLFQAATDGKDQLAAAWGRQINHIADRMKVWVGNEVGQGPHQGVIVEYVGGRETMKRLMRCPDHEQGVWNSGIGSNGKFDYSMAQLFAGAFTSDLPMTGQVVDPITGTKTDILPILVVEEDPMFWINRIHIESGWGNVDRVGTWHPFNQSNYLATDGSVQDIRFAEQGQGADNYGFFTITPKGQWTNYYQGLGYGRWNAR